MAIVKIPDENRTLSETAEIVAYLASIGIDYERWELKHMSESSPSSEAILAAYGAEIARLKHSGRYVAADVIDVTPGTPNLEAMLAKFSQEHWHDEDEVRFIIRGRGLFHIRPRRGRLTAIEVEAGDLIRVPSGTWHWFDLCGDRTIQAIRLFQDPSGWTPHYTHSGVERSHQPLCLGASYLPPRPTLVRP